MNVILLRCLPLKAIVLMTLGRSVLIIFYLSLNKGLGFSIFFRTSLGFGPYINYIYIQYLDFFQGDVPPRLLTGYIEMRKTKEISEQSQVALPHYLEYSSIIFMVFPLLDF